MTECTKHGQMGAKSCLLVGPVTGQPLARALGEALARAGLQASPACACCHGCFNRLHLSLSQQLSAPSARGGRRWHQLCPSAAHTPEDSSANQLNVVLSGREQPCQLSCQAAKSHVTASVTVRIGGSMFTPGSKLRTKSRGYRLSRPRRRR